MKNVSEEKRQSIILTKRITCRRCKIEKSIDDFSINRRHKIGKCVRCKKCFKELYDAKIMATFPERTKARAVRRLQRMSISPKRKVDTKIFGTLKRAIHSNGQSKVWKKLSLILDYSFEEFKRHIENNFIETMTWDLILSGRVEIDHKIPCAAFHYEDLNDSEVKECWGLKNLQPLWRGTNRRKCDRMPDGTAGRRIGNKKRLLLAEESSVAGWEIVKNSEEEVFG